MTANKAFILGYTNENKTYNNKAIIFDDFTLNSKYVDFPFMVKSSALKILVNKEGYDLKFLHELLANTEIEIMGHARHYISVVQNTEIGVPSLEEQQKISGFFKSLNNLITLHQRKLSLLG